MGNKNILDLIGNTPLVCISRLHSKPGVNLLAKLESFNPGGSVKDRVALAMVERAERLGEINRDKTIIEATSGNTGIGLAMVCAVKGYPLMLIMPESASEERKRIMSAYGAQLYLTPGHLSTDGAIEEAYRLAREEPDKYVLMDQFNNEASIEAHYHGTAMEIWKQTAGSVTHVVTALGTSGTAMGLSARLKELNPHIEIVAVEPYAGHKIQGLKNMQASYPPGIYNKRKLDRILHVDDENAFSLCRDLASKEAVFAGMSSGAALGGALQLASEISQGTIVVIFPDGGERYLSTPLFVPPSQQGLALYNIKYRQEEYLQIQKSPICLFSTGPSSDDPGNLEDWRRLVFLDLLSRYLQFKDVECLALIGLADLDDQAVEQARVRGQNQEGFSAEFIRIVQNIGSILGIGDGVRFTAASYMQDKMLEYCQNLLGKGRAYEKLSSVYYDVFRDPDYGQLVRADLGKLSLGKTVDLEDYVKDNPRDFTLLKRASLKNLKAGEFIKTQWGNVRPSWYLQMAASASQCLEKLKVVMAGRSLQFPHLENLRAIWSKAQNNDPQVWMVIQNINYKDGISDRLDVHTVSSRLINTLALRMWLLSISYRKPLVLSRDSLQMWQNNWKRVQNLVAGVTLMQKAQGEISRDVEQCLFDLKSGFTDCMEKDLSLYKFWPILFDFCKTVHQRLNQGRLTGAEAGEIISRLKDMDRVLGIIDWGQIPVASSQWPAEISEMVRSRDEAKRRKDFKQADLLREKIREAGYQIEDTPSGVRLYRVKYGD